jgi:ABC-type uncharacterized transport system YnjBCD ATPase subunit
MRSRPSSRQDTNSELLTESIATRVGWNRLKLLRRKHLLLSQVADTVRKVWLQHVSQTGRWQGRQTCATAEVTAIESIARNGGMLFQDVWRENKSVGRKLLLLLQLLAKSRIEKNHLDNENNNWSAI